MCAVNANSGHVEMRIGRSVSMTGEMFDRGHHSPFMRAFDIGGDEISDLLRILAERARINNGIGGIRINVGVGEEIPVNADCARLFGRDAAESLSIFDLAISTESHSMREYSGAHQPHGYTAFKIGGKY